MKNIILALLGTLVLIHAQDTSKTYLAKWDALNVKEIVDNGRIFGKYKQCLTTEKVSGCPQEVQELKEMLINALESASEEKWSPSQLMKVRESLAYVCRIRGADFIEILQHFDPTGDKRAQFETKFGKLQC